MDTTEKNLENEEALGLQAISIRLPKELINYYKVIAKYHQIGYQALMKDALRQFTETEFKRIVVAELAKKQKRQINETNIQTLQRMQSQI